MSTATSPSPSAHATAPLLAPDARGVLVSMIDHHLGNFVIALPVIEALLGYFHQPPDVIVDERYVPLVASLPSAGQVLAYPTQAVRRRGVVKNLKPMAAMASLGLNRYRTVVDFGGSQRAAMLTGSTLARQRIGYRQTKQSWVYNHPLHWEAADHAFDNYGNLLWCIGQAGRPPLVRLRASEADRTALDAALKRHAPDPMADLLLIHPGAGHAWRQWPAERFAAVADALHECHGLHACIIGAPGERAVMAQVHNAMRHRDAGFPLNVPLPQLLPLMERSALLVSNESGPTHLAAATALPIATIFGPSRESLWHPIRHADTIVLRGDTCDPGCVHRRCVADSKCLRRLDVARVLDAAERLLAGAPAPSAR